MRIEFSVLTRYTVDYPYEKDASSDEKFHDAAEEICKKTAEVVARSTLVDTTVEYVSERHPR